MSVFTGSNLNHDVVYLDFCLTASLEMIVKGWNGGTVRKKLDKIKIMKDKKNEKNC